MIERVAVHSRPLSATRIPSNILGALQGVNRELLEGLRHSILSGRETVPLPKEVARRIAGMSDAQLALCSKCGILLVDLHFLQSVPLAEIEALASCDYELDCTMPMESWLSPVQFVSLAHSTLMSAWHLCQWDIECATVLTGIDRSFALGIAGTESIEMSIMARKFGHLILPRWHAREAIWQDLLSRGLDESSPGSVNMTVRGLQLSARIRNNQIGRPIAGSMTAGTTFGRKPGSNPALSASRS